MQYLCRLELNFFFSLNALTYLFVNFTEDFPRRFDIEQPDNYSCVLTLQIGDCGRRICEKALSGRDLDFAQFGTVVKVIQRLEQRRKKEQGIRLNSTTR